MQTNKNNKASYLKKKLFVTGGYLVIAAMLLCIVSFAQYKITIPEEGRTVPTAGQIRTNLVLQPTLASHSQAWVTNEWVNNLQPGQKAKTYATMSSASLISEKNNHRMELYIYQQDTENSDVTVDFNLRIQSAGRIPLEFYIKDVEFKDSNGDPVLKSYVSVPIINTDPTSDYVEYMFVEDEANLNLSEEAKFSLKRDAADPVHMDIYIGWNNSGYAYDADPNIEPGASRIVTIPPEELTALSYRKEVDLLCINANVLSHHTKGYTHLTLKSQAN